MTNAELYKQLTLVNDLHKALVEHFAYLADTTEFAPVLKAVMGVVQSVSLSDANMLVLHFPNNGEFECSEPAAAGGYNNWCVSYQKLMAKHELITFPDNGGWALELGDIGSLDPDMFEDGDSDFLTHFDNTADILCPLTDYSDWWVYHPTAKNAQGEPMLCLASHESADIEEYVQCNIGALFLKRVAEYLDLDDMLPNVTAQEPNTQKTADKKQSESANNTKALTDDDIYKLLSKAEKEANVAEFIAKLEELHNSGSKLAESGADSLILHTSNLIVECLNKEIDPFPVFEALVRLYPDARRKRFRDQISYNVGNFIAAIKDHKEYYPQIKATYMDGIINDDNASALYFIAIKLANMGLINEALVELQRVEESNASPMFIPLNPDDFPAEMKDRVAQAKETLKKRFLANNS